MYAAHPLPSAPHFVVVFFFFLSATTFNQIVAEGGDGEEIVYGKLDLSLLGKYREALPSLKHIRKDIFHV